MVMPKKIAVGPFDFEIVCDQNAINAEAVEARSGLYGSTDKKRARITLHPDNAPSVMRETLFHEVLHAVNTVCAIDVDLSVEDEERYVRRQAPVLLETLRRNKALVAYLLTT